MASVKAVYSDRKYILRSTILVRCVTEHEYGERGSAGDREMGTASVV
jgi:hypothetical protein